MSKLTPVPHRNSLPTTQIGHRYDISADRSQDAYERAMDLAYDEFQAYSGHRAVQDQILSDAIDDVNFSDEVEAASRRISSTALITGLYNYSSLIVKDETEQSIKAYKIRGATNFIHIHKQQAQQAGVTTASAGNHGQAVALAAHKIGVEAVIVLPEGTPEVKKQAILAYGGRIIVHGHDYDSANQKALEINDRQHGLYVPAFDHRDIMAGQATVALELLRQAPGITDLVVPTGGGGLIAGIAKYLHVAAPHIRVHAAGVTSESAVETAFLEGNNSYTRANRFADGIAVGKVGTLTWPEIRRHVSQVFTVEETDVRRTVGVLSLQGHMLEGAGAIGIAAAIAHRSKLGQRPAVIATGGNIDPAVLLACQKLVANESTDQLTESRKFSTI